MHKKVIDLLQSFVDMNKMLELRELELNLDYLNCYSKFVYVQKLKNRYGDKNQFAHKYILVDFGEENIRFRVQISCELDDDRQLQNRLAKVFKNYNGYFRYLVGGCSFIFYFKEPEELGNLLSEVI